MNHENKEEVENNNHSQRHIQFTLGESSFVVELLQIKEFIPVPTTTSLPQSPDYLKGVMDLRGDIVTIVDLRKLLGITPRQENVEETVLIVEREGHSIGLIVDFVQNVITFSSDEVSQKGDISHECGNEHIQGVYRGSEGLAIILDLESVIYSRNLGITNHKAV